MKIHRPWRSILDGCELQRHMVVTVFAVVVRAAIGIVLAGGPNVATAAQPNVILIMADDISANEFPVHGVADGGVGNSNSGTPVRTPNLDRLASEGASLKTTWSAPICSPTRAMIMTGRYAHRHGWFNNGQIATNDQGKKLPFYESSVDSTGQPQVIGHVAKQAGYTTYWTGKTQMKQGDLTRYGFDEGLFYSGYNERLNGQINPYSDFQASQPYNQASWYWGPRFKRMNYPGDPNTFAWEPVDQETDYGPDVYLRGMFDFINRHTDDPTTASDDGEDETPFFAYYTANLGHDGVDYLNAVQQPNGDYLCSGCSPHPGTPTLVLDEQTGRWTKEFTVNNPVDGVTDAHIDRHIEYLDFQVQEITDELERLGIADNTVLIFTTDNGTLGYGKGNATKQRGVHVPFIIHAPGQLAVQGEQDVLSDLTDVWPTLADIVGYEPPADYEVDGDSLWDYLTGETSEHREWISSYLGEKQFIRGDNVLRDGNGNWWDTRGAVDGDSFVALTANSDPELLAEKRMLELALEGLPSLAESQFAGELLNGAAAIGSPSAGSIASVVPEPATSWLGAVAIVLMLCRFTVF